MTDCPLHSYRATPIPGSSNGRTWAFEAQYLGSNPSPGTNSFRGHSSARIANANRDFIVPTKPRLTPRMRTRSAPYHIRVDPV